MSAQSCALAKAGRGSSKAFDVLLGRIEANDFYMLDECNACDLTNVVYACVTSNRPSDSFSEKLCAHITSSKCDPADFKGFLEEPFAKKLRAHINSKQLKSG